MRTEKRRKPFFLLALLLLFLCQGCTAADIRQTQTDAMQESAAWAVAPEDKQNEPYAVLNGNVPYFTQEEKASREAFENYSELDGLGRCGVAYANICPELMPTQERGEIGSVKPSGWHLVKYDIVEGKYLYNRCHLIAYQLAGENANEKNLITGTRYFNVMGMLPFENEVADYVRETGNHVLYRVTPVFTGDNLVADGVQMEAYSVEDNGEGICFCVFVYNKQPGVSIDYKTGESRLLAETVETAADNDTETADGQDDAKAQEYIVNTNSKKFHLPDCSSVSDIKEKNKKTITAAREDLLADGYEPCGRCHP